MKNSRKFILTSLCGLAAIGIYACSSTGHQGEPGAAGAKGDGCSVVTNADGTGTIKCTDGSSFNIVNGKDANPGDAGSDGKDGQNGKSCYLTENIDGSTAVVCPYDGSSYIVRGNTDNYANYCKEGFWGKNCENECNCNEYQDCNDGLTGDGSCSCKENFWGENCQNECNCNDHQDCNDGVTGDGSCSCKDNWDGQNCDECADGYTGLQCVRITCNTANGILNEENGKCSTCNYGWTDDNCDSCPANWDNSEEGKCARCDNTHYGDNCQNTKDTMKDKHGNTYFTVKIGEQEWMAENMRDETDVDCIKDPSNTDWTDDYGCLYTWDDAMKVCPSGWKLPEQKDFKQLLTATGADSDSSGIRASSWENGSNSSGFGALPAGFRFSDGDFNDFGSGALFWSATPIDSDGAYLLYVLSGYALVDCSRVNDAFSVRCLKDSN